MFIHSHRYGPELQALLEEAPADAAADDEVCMAIAFWSRGSSTRLPSRRGRRYRVICNLLSGATNPSAIRELLDRGDVDVKRCRILHAKVVLTARALLVGSANLSSNGLSLEADETGGWIEAGLVTSEQAAMQHARQWFDALWSNPSISFAVTEHDLEVARETWKRRRRERLDPYEADHDDAFRLDAWTSRQLRDRDVHVVIYRQHLQGEAAEAAERFRDAVHRAAPARRDGEPDVDIGATLDFYQTPTRGFWSRAGAELIDLYWGPRGGIRCRGAATTLGKAHPIGTVDSNDEMLQVVTVAERLFAGRHRFNASDARQFEKHVKGHMQALWDAAGAYSKPADEQIRWLPLGEVAKRVQGDSAAAPRSDRG